MAKILALVHEYVGSSGCLSWALLQKALISFLIESGLYVHKASEFTGKFELNVDCCCCTTVCKLSKLCI